MKKILVLTMATFMLFGCLSKREIPEYYNDPAYRDSVLLFNNVASYGTIDRKSLFDDVHLAFIAEDDELRETEEKEERSFLNSLMKISREDLRFLKYLYDDYAQLAVLAEYAYQDSEILLPEGWVDAGEQDPRVKEIIEIFTGEENFSTGLKCSLLHKGDRQVLAFAGTDFPSDWSDFSQLMHFVKDAYEDVNGALNDDAYQPELAGRLIDKLLSEGKISIDRLEFAGHSLGGRLASEMAVSYGCPATVFNSAGVAPGVYERYESIRSQKSKSWRGYIVDITSSNDQLTCLQKYISGSTDPYLTELTSSLSEDEGTVSNLLSIGKNLWRLVTDDASSRSALFESITSAISEYYNRDFRALGANLCLRECMSGHSIRPLSDYLRARSEACENAYKDR